MDKKSKEIVLECKILKCKKCKNIVWIEKIDNSRDKRGIGPCIDTCHPDYLAFHPQFSFEEKIPTEKVSKCTCKTADFSLVSAEYSKYEKEKKDIEKKMKFLRGICPHNEWTLSNFGDYRMHQVSKMCVACGKKLDYATKKEIDQWLKKHPEYKFDGYSLTTIVGNSRVEDVEDDELDW